MSGLKFVKKRNAYEKRNLTFSVETGYAYSYGWYCIAKPIAGVLVVNSFNYSRTTSRHCREIVHLARTIGYEKILMVEAPMGLNAQAVTKKHYAEAISSLEKAIAKPRSRDSANRHRREAIRILKNTYEMYVELIQSEEFDEQISTLLVTDPL